MTNADDDNSPFTLTPAFDSAVDEYTLSVPNSVSQVVVSHETNDDEATAFFEDADEKLIDEGAAPFQYELAFGMNLIQAKVVAQDGETFGNYFLRITRAPLLPDNPNWRSEDSHTPPKITVFEVQVWWEENDVDGTVHLSWQFPSPDMTECLDDPDTDEDESVTCSIDGYRITYAEWPTTSRANPKPPTAAELESLASDKWTDIVIDAYNDPDCVWDYHHGYGGNIQSCTWSYDAPEPDGMSRFYRIAARYYKSDDSDPPVVTVVEGDLSDIRPYVKGGDEEDE